jgi:hypothetical protein
MSAHDVTSIHLHIRESEHAARRLIARAAHLEKRASRPRTDAAERLSLTGTAGQLRAAAAELLLEVSDLSRRVRLPDR